MNSASKLKHGCEQWISKCGGNIVDCNMRKHCHLRLSAELGLNCLPVWNTTCSVSDTYMYVYTVWEHVYTCVFQPYEVVEMCVPLTLKADGMNVYRVTLMALVSTTADWPLKDLDDGQQEFCSHILWLTTNTHHIVCVYGASINHKEIIKRFCLNINFVLKWM